MFNQQVLVEVHFCFSGKEVCLFVNKQFNQFTVPPSFPLTDRTCCWCILGNAVLKSTGKTENCHHTLAQSGADLKEWPVPDYILTF